MANNADIELLGGLGINSSEAEILKAIKVIQQRLRANTDATIKLNVDIDETTINNAITKLQNILQNKNLRIETQDSIMAITEEANAMLDVVESARRATQEKLDFAKANEKVRNSADDTADAINRERAAMNNLDDLDTILQNVNMNGRQGASVFQQFGNSLRDATATYTTVNLLHEGLEKVVSAGKEAIEITKKFDDINVDLQMATGEDKNYVKGLLSDYAELGGELGALTETVAESADTFLRQGRSMEETNQLIEDAIVLSKVAQTSGEKASEILTATINGFQLAATEGSRVSDILSSIDLNSASSAEGIGEALTKTASMAHNAGVSLEKTAAMIATIKDVTQDADTTIGTSLKTVLSRMNSIRAGKFIDEESGEALNDVEKVLGAIGISMRDVNGQFKEAESIIDDVGTKWKSFDSNTQKAVTTAMGGVYQANKLTALFDNYDKVIELTKVAEESAGTALQKFNDSYLPSLEAKTNALKSSLQSLGTTTISDEFYGSVLDTTKAIVDMTTETGILKGLLAGLATSGAVYAFEHLTAYLHDATQEFANLGEAMQITRGANGTITDIQRLIDLTGGLTESQTRLLLNTRNLTDAQKTAILVNQYLAQGMDDDLARATAEATLQTWGLTTAQQGATGAAITLRNTLRGLWATLLSNPLIAVTAVVTAGVAAFTQYKQAQEEAIQTTKEAAGESADLSDELSDLTSKYLSLTDAVNDGESAKEDLLDVQDQLIEKLGLESDELDNLIEKYGTLDEKVQNYIQNEAIKKMQEARHDLIAGYETAIEELLSVGSSGKHDNVLGTGIDLGIDNRNGFNVFGSEELEALKVLKDAKIGEVHTAFGVGGSFILNGNDDTVKGVISNYEQLKEAMLELERVYGSNASKLDLFDKIYARYKELQPYVEGLSGYIDNINENEATMLRTQLLQTMEFPDTAEELTTFREQLLQTALSSDDFVGTQEDIERAVDATMKTISSASKVTGSNGSDDDTVVSNKFLTDEQKKAIEDYKTLMKEIANIKENAEDYTLSDLATTFSEYDWSNFINGTESLDTALRKIASGSLADVRTALVGLSGAEPILEELRQTLLATFEGNDFGWSENLGHYDALNKLLNKVREGYKFSKDEITNILGDYDLFGDIKKLKDGYSIDEDALISLINDYAEKHNESLQKVREELEKMGVNPDSVLGTNAYKALIDTSSKKEPEEPKPVTFDWIEPLIEEAEKKLNDLDAVVNDTYASFDDRREALQGQIEATMRLIDLQSKAEQAYMDEANKIGLDQSYIDKIQKGELDIETLDGNKDEVLIDKIKSYQDLWESAQQCKEDNEELLLTLNVLEKQLFTLSQTEADLNIDELTRSISDLETELEKADYLNSIDELSTLDALSDKNKTLAETYYDTADSLKAIYERLLEFENIDPESEGMKLLLGIIEGYKSAGKDAEQEAMKYDTQKYDSLVAQYERTLVDNENRKKAIETELAKAEAKGYINTANYYNRLINEQLTNQKTNNEKLTALQEELTRLEAEYPDFEGTAVWHEKKLEIDEVTLALEEGELALIDYANAIRQIKWDVFDFLQEQIETVSDEASFLIDLFSNMEQFDDKGQLTDIGWATMGNHAVIYETSLAQAKKYAEELAEIEKDIADKPNDTNLIKRKNELIGLYQDETLAAEQAKQAMIDMVQEGINLELESLSKLIDSYKEALQAQKDLYDWQKKSANLSKNIANLKKQLSVYEKSLAEEDKAKVQKLKVQLESAYSDMDDMQYDYYLSEQDELLTSLYTEYENVLNERMDNVDVLFEELMADVNANSSAIAETIRTQANGWGYTLQSELQNIWNSQDFENTSNSIAGAVSGALGKIDTDISNMESSLNTKLDSKRSITECLKKCLDT